MTKETNIKLTLTRSPAGCLPRHRATIASLGLRRMHQSVQVKDSPSAWGMIKKVAYLLKVEEVK